MSSESERSSMSEEPSGRHFSLAMKDVSGRIDRADALRVGDYINIDPKLFAQWAGTMLAGNLESLNGQDSVRVTVEEIIYDDEARRNPSELVVSCGELRRKIPASLFYSYNRPPEDAGFVVTNLLVEDSPHHDGTPSGWH